MKSNTLIFKRPSIRSTQTCWCYLTFWQNPIRQPKVWNTDRAFVATSCLTKIRTPNRGSRNKQKVCRLQRVKDVSEHPLDVQKVRNHEARIPLHSKDLPRIPYAPWLCHPPCLSLIILIQFHLLVACVFLNTEWEAAIPQAQNLLQQYPTPETLAKAQYHDIQPFFAHLGFFKRAKWLIKLAESWLLCPPQTDKLYTKRGRPTFKSEIAHLQGVGSFANDAWRIFCKDDLYTRAGFRIETPEWKRVAPNNKRLIAYLRHRWDKEGIVWDQGAGTSQSASLLEEETVASTDTIGLETLISSVSHDHRDCMYGSDRIHPPCAD